MNFTPRNSRRGSLMIFIVIGILLVATWIGTDHTGRLMNLIGVQRETMQRLRSSDVPVRTGNQAPCEATWSDPLLPEQVR